MKVILSIIKDDKTITIGLTLCSLFYLFLFPDKIVALIAVLLSSVISFLILRRCIKLRKEREKELAGSNFLHAFMNGLEHDEGAKESYEHASKYLIGHYEIKDYDTFIESGYELRGDETERRLLDHICAKEREGEVHLLSYREPLILIQEKAIRMKNELSALKNNLLHSQLALLFMLLIVSLIINLSPVIKATLESDVYSIIAVIATSFFYPALLLEYLFKLKELR